MPVTVARPARIRPDRLPFAIAPLGISKWPSIPQRIEDALKAERSKLRGPAQPGHSSRRIIAVTIACAVCAVRPFAVAIASVPSFGVVARL